MAKLRWNTRATLCCRRGIFDCFLIGLILNGLKACMRYITWLGSSLSIIIVLLLFYRSTEIKIMKDDILLLTHLVPAQLVGFSCNHTISTLHTTILTQILYVFDWCAKNNLPFMRYYLLIFSFVLFGEPWSRNGPAMRKSSEKGII